LKGKERPKICPSHGGCPSGEDWQGIGRKRCGGVSSQKKRTEKAHQTFDGWPQTTTKEKKRIGFGERGIPPP